MDRKIKSIKSGTAKDNSRTVSQSTGMVRYILSQ